MFRIMFNGKEIAHIIGGNNLTLEQAIKIGLGIDVNSQEDCRKAYGDGAEYAYLDDCGYYHVDTEAMEESGVW